MPIIKLKHIVSFSSEDKTHGADNLLKGNTDGKWRCEKCGEKQASVVIQLEKATTISSVDIGNDGSAFVEVLVSRSTGDEAYQVLLVASSFMSPLESRNGSGCNRVRMFGTANLSQDAVKQKWDRVKVVCTQPFNKHKTYGLNFINFHTTEQLSDPVAEIKTEPKATTASHGSTVGRSSFGSFKLKPEKDEEIPSARSQVRAQSSGTPNKPIQFQNLKRKLNADNDQVSEKKTKVSIAQVKKEPSASILTKDDSPSSEVRTETSAKPTSKPAQSKKTSSKSTLFPEILRKVVFVISGFQNPTRAEIRDKALEMGAQYKRDWGPTCTHLVCAFPNTPKFQQVMGTMGHIVRADWIHDCYREKRRLPWQQYSMNPHDTSDSDEEEQADDPITKLPADPYTESTDEEDSPDTEDEIRRIRKKQNDEKPINSPQKSNADPYDVSTDEEGVEDAVTTLADLPDYFSGRHFLLHGDFEEGVERMLKRHITTCAGTISNYMSDDVRYVVTESSWQPMFDDALADNSSVVFVRPLWIFKCGQAKKLVPYQSYTVPAN